MAKNEKRESLQKTDVSKIDKAKFEDAISIIRLEYTNASKKRLPSSNSIIFDEAKLRRHVLWLISFMHQYDANDRPISATLKKLENLEKKFSDLAGELSKIHGWDVDFFKEPVFASAESLPFTSLENIWIKQNHSYQKMKLEVFLQECSNFCKEKKSNISNIINKMPSPKSVTQMGSNGFFWGKRKMIFVINCASIFFEALGKVPTSYVDGKFSEFVEAVWEAGKFAIPQQVSRAFKDEIAAVVKKMKNDPFQISSMIFEIAPVFQARMQQTIEKFGPLDD